MKIVKASAVLLLGMLLATVFACGGGSGQESTLTPTPMWATYSNISLGISIQYPQEWTKSEDEVAHVAFFTPKTDDSVSPGVVLISVYELEQEVDFSDFVDDCAQAIRLYLSGNIIESTATTIDDMSAHSFVYTWEAEDDGALMKSMEIHTIKNRKDYIITYMVYENYYDNYLETAQQMIDSFVIY